MEKNDQKLLLNIAIITGGYFLIIKPLLEKLGITKSAEELAIEAEKKANVKDQITALSKKGLKLTKSKAEWDQIADKIYADLRYSKLDDDKADAGLQVSRVQNDLDMAYLIQSFGKRQEYLFGIPDGQPKDLAKFITDNLSSDQINRINWNYESKKMKYRFR